MTLRNTTTSHYPEVRQPTEDTMANPFVHVELATTDVAKAKSFYQSLFAWKLKVGDGTGGGMMKHPMPEHGSHWLPYVLVDDIAAATAKAKSLGATIVKD